MGIDQWFNMIFLPLIRQMKSRGILFQILTFKPFDEDVSIKIEITYIGK